MNTYEDRRNNRQQENERREERNKGQFSESRSENGSFGGSQAQRPVYGSDQRWREDRGDWRNEAARSERFGQNGPQNYPNDRYGNEQYSNKIYNDDHYRDQAYRGTKYADRERRNSQYSNPDYRYQNDYQHTQYGSFGDARDERSGLTQGQREAYNEVLFSRGAYDPNVDGRSLGNRHHVYTGPSHRGKGPKNYIRQDVHIKDDVNQALTESHSVDATDVEVMVEDGNVILSGTVDSRLARRNAESAVDYISGIRNIENRIHIKSQTDRDVRSEVSNVQSKKKTDAKNTSAKSQNGKAKA